MCDTSSIGTATELIGAAATVASVAIAANADTDADTDAPAIPSITPASTVARATPILNKTTGANVRFGSDAAALRNKRLSKVTNKDNVVSSTTSNTGLFL